MEVLYANLFNITWQQVAMWVIGGILIFLAIKKEMEPTLLLPMGFGAIIMNLPFDPISGSGVGHVLDRLFDIGIADYVAKCFCRDNSPAMCHCT